jgi:hypothetical protein
MNIIVTGLIAIALQKAITKAFSRYWDKDTIIRSLFERINPGDITNMLLSLFKKIRVNAP